jgi:hypothetical protein
VANINRFADGQRASIGDYYVTEACTVLNRNWAVECAMFVPELDRRALIPMLFDDVGVEKLRAAFPYAASAAMSQHYELEPYINGTLGLNFNFDGLGMCPAEQLHVYTERFDPFIAAIKAVQDLRAKWGAVKHTLRWCNNYLTPGAIRNLWPSAMALCPTSPAMREIQRETPVRYSSPVNLGEYLPLLRYTAGVVAASKMLPQDMQPSQRNGVWLTFHAEKVMVEGCSVSLDAGLINLG